LVLIAALLFAGTAAAQPGFVEHYKAATAAHGAKDYARMEAELLEALKLRPGHPTATYNLACARALRGDVRGAVKALRDLADMGLAVDATADPDLASLKGDRGFEAVRGAFARNSEPRGEAAHGFGLASPTYIPEGIAYDPKRRQFYVGSVHERRIQRVPRDGAAQDFVAPGAGLWAVLGMAVDPARDLLWAATAAIEEMRDAAPGEVGRTAIVAYALESGEQKHRFVLDDGPGPRQFGDLLVHGDDVYATDSRGGALYVLDLRAGPGHGTFRALTAAGAMSSPQGLALAADGKHLYVADYTRGLFRYALDGGALERVEAAPGVGTYGIDGLYRHGNGLVAIQNGNRPHRVVRLQLAGGGRRVRAQRVLAANLEAFDEPTLGVVVGDEFWFVANSQWNKFREDHTLPPPDQLRPPRILRIRLDR
jgi:sugar lactone lactonase YvrE